MNKLYSRQSTVKLPRPGQLSEAASQSAGNMKRRDGEKANAEIMLNADKEPESSQSSVKNDADISQTWS